MSWPQCICLHSAWCHRLNLWSSLRFATASVFIPLPPLLRVLTLSERKKLSMVVPFFWLALIRGLNLKNTNIINERGLQLRHTQVLGMGVCTGCAVSFSGLDKDICMKCLKLAAAHSSTERGLIEVSIYVFISDKVIQSSCRSNHSVSNAL